MPCTVLSERALRVIVGADALTALLAQQAQGDQRVLRGTVAVLAKASRALVGHLEAEQPGRAVHQALDTVRSQFGQWMGMEALLLQPRVVLRRELVAACSGDYVQGLALVPARRSAGSGGKPSPVKW